MMEAFKIKYPSLYPERVTTQGEKMNAVIQQVREHLEVRDSLISKQNASIELSRQIIEQQEELIGILRDQISVMTEHLQIIQE